MMQFVLQTNGGLRGPFSLLYATVGCGGHGYCIWDRNLTDYNNLLAVLKQILHILWHNPWQILIW